MSTNEVNTANYVAILRELADQLEMNEKLVRQLEQSNEHIATAFHPDVGWAVRPEQLEASEEELKNLQRVLAEAMANTDHPLPNYLAIVLQNSFGIKPKHNC